MNILLLNPATAEPAIIIGSFVRHFLQTLTEFQVKINRCILMASSFTKLQSHITYRMIPEIHKYCIISF